MKVIVVKPFRYAFEGYRVVDFPAGEQELPDEVAAFALAEKWAVAEEAKPKARGRK